MTWQGGKAFRLVVCLPATTIAIVVLASSCVFLKPASTPVPREYYNYDDSNSTLILLLPGLGESPANFVKYGTVKQISICQPAANILGVDSHFAYYREDKIVERLHEDIIVPARLAGVRHIWLLGISLGGLGSLLYRQQYPDEIEAVIVMAPYLGEWDALTAYLTDRDGFLESSDNHYPELWDGLTNPPVAAPEIILAFGENDKYSKQQRWLAGLLDQNKVLTAPGGHRWAVWKTLWPNALKRSGLCDS